MNPFRRLLKPTSFIFRTKGATKRPSCVRLAFSGPLVLGDASADLGGSVKRSRIYVAGRQVPLSDGVSKRAV